MATEKKRTLVAELAEMLSRSTIAILTVPTGMTVAEMTDLRRRLREAGGDFRVVKNTLARFAAQQVGKEALESLLTGPTAIAFGYGDQRSPAKTLLDYSRGARAEVRIKGGILDNRLLTPQEVRQLGLLPGREVLLAQLLGGLQLPLGRLVWVLKGNLAGLLQVLQARKEQLEKEAAT